METFMTKCGIQVNEGLCLLEIIDPDTLERVEPGEEGEVVVSLLEREALPLLRYRTGDASILIEEECECGRTEARLLRIAGRIDMLTKVRGVFIHPKQVAEIISKYPELKFQIVVERPEIYDEMTVIVECSKNSKFKEMQKILEKELRETLRVKTRVKIVTPGEIPP